MDEKVRGGLHSLVSLSSAQKTAVVEHVLGHRVQGPVVALSRVSRFPGYLYEAVVERQVVPDGVLPGGKLVPIVREPGHDEFADAAQGELLVRRLQYGHGDQRYVTVRRLDGRSVAGGRSLVAVLAARALLRARRSRLAAATAVIVVVASGRDHCRVVVVVVVGRIDVHVGRLGRADAARRRHGRRCRAGLHHRCSGRGSDASQVQRADHLMHDRRVQGGLISAAKIVNGKEHGGCRGRSGGRGRRSGQSTSAAATVAAAAAAAVVLVLLVTVLLVMVMIVVLHSGGANHHAAHLVTVSDVMYDDENWLEN